MPIIGVVSSDTTPSYTGTIDYTLAGFGVPSSAIILFQTADSTANPEDTSQYAIWFVDNLGGSVSIATRSQDNTAITDETRGAKNPGCDFAGGLTARLQFSAWITDGIRINYTASFGSPGRLTIILFKNLINSKAFTHLSTGSNVTDDINSVGFQPDIVFSTSIGYTQSDETGGADHANLQLGIVHNGSGGIIQYTYANMGENAVNISNAQQTINTQYGGIKVSITNIIERELDFSAFDSNGFSTTQQDVGEYHYYLALKLNNQDDAKLIQFDSSTSLGNSSVTGVGFQPSSLLCVSPYIDTLNTIIPGNALSIGVADGTNQASAYLRSQNGQALSNAENGYSTSNVINVIDQADVTTIAAELVSFDTDGFTLNYLLTDTGTPRKFIGLAFREGVVGVRNNPLLFGQDF